MAKSKSKSSKSKRLTKEEKQARYKKSMAIFIAVIMAFSIIGFIGIGSSSTQNSQGPEPIEYNGFRFESQNGLWRLNNKGTTFYFQAPPTAVENINVPSSINNLLKSDKVYVTKHQNEQIDITSLLLFYKALFIQEGIQSFEACLEEEGCGDLPIINCEEDTAIVAKIADETKVYQDQKCIVLAAPNELSRARLAERVAYSLLGVMQ